MGTRVVLLGRLVLVGWPLTFIQMDMPTKVDVEAGVSGEGETERVRGKEGEGWELKGVKAKSPHSIVDGDSLPIFVEQVLKALLKVEVSPGRGVAVVMANAS